MITIAYIIIVNQTVSENYIKKLWSSLDIKEGKGDRVCSGDYLVLFVEKCWHFLKTKIKQTPMHNG